jgi:hypothetical protein
LSAARWTGARASAAAAAAIAALATAARADGGPAPPPAAQPAGCEVFVAGPSYEPRPGALESLGADPLETRFRALGREVTVRFGGRVAADLARYGRSNLKESGLVPVAIEPRADLWSGELRLRIALDLHGTDSPRPVREAFAEWTPTAALRVRAGQQRVGLGTEAATEDEDLPLPGRNFNAHLDGRHDLALQADAATAGGVLWGQATLAAGKGFGLEGSRVASPMAALRAAVFPFARARGALRANLGGLFVGGAHARLGSFDSRVVLATPADSVVFTTPRLDGRSGSWTRYEVGWVEGPIAFGWERTLGEARDVRRPFAPVACPGSCPPFGRRPDFDELTAWSASLSVRLTGEEPRWERGAWREAPPLPGGSWTLAARYSNGDIDRDLFQAGFTRYDPSSQETRTFTAGLGWAPRPGMRVTLAFVRTIADHELSTFRGGARDASFLLRFEAVF